MIISLADFLEVEWLSQKYPYCQSTLQKVCTRLPPTGGVEEGEIVPWLLISHGTCIFNLPQWLAVGWLRVAFFRDLQTLQGPIIVIISKIYLVFILFPALW